MSVNVTNPVQGFQSNVTNLESVRTSAEGVRVSLQEQLRQDQEAMITTLTSVFQQTMQTALAESETRQNAIIDGLRAENNSLQRKVEMLEARLANKVDCDVFNRHYHVHKIPVSFTNDWTDGPTI